VIHTPVQRIGIEIADIHHGSRKKGSKVKQAESGIDQMMRFLKKRLDSLAVPPVDESWTSRGEPQAKSTSSRQTLDQPRPGLLQLIRPSRTGSETSGWAA
jgi:hypothetical protein